MGKVFPFELLRLKLLNGVELRMFGNQKGFSLVGSLVSLAVLSAASLGFMKLMTSHFKANAAVSNDLEREAMKRSLMQRVDCEKTGEANGQTSPRRKTAVELRSRSGRVVLPLAANGQKMGKFHYRALNLGNGVIQVESRMVDATGNVVKHPVLANVKRKNSAGVEVSANYDWNPLFSPETPLCDLRDLQGADPENPAKEGEDLSAELVYHQSGRFQALRGDIRIDVELVLDGGLDCRSDLVFQCDGGGSIRVSDQDPKGSVLLPKDRFCTVEVKNAGGSNCASGTINKANGLTAKQGFNQWRVQWEDRLADRKDSLTCAAVKDPVAKLSNAACQRLKAIDWNDAIWHIRGAPVRNAAVR